MRPSHAFQLRPQPVTRHVRPPAHPRAIRTGARDPVAARLTSLAVNRFRSLAMTSTAATLLLVLVGGIVRSTKSGLGCGTDWPHCSGRLIPALENRAVVIEYSHRLIAAVVLVLIGLLAVQAFRHARSSPAILWPAFAAFALVVGQALLGAVVVWLELEATSVVLHLGTAMALLGVLVYLVTASLERNQGTAGADRALSRAAAWAAGAVLVVLLSGSYVTGSDAGYVFPDWPLMNGRPVPDLAVHTHAVHFAHRALAAAAGVIVVAVAVRALRRRAELPAAARLAHFAAGAFAIQVLIGAANIWTRLHPAVVTAHLFLGAVMWASLVAVASIAHPAVSAAREPRAPARAPGALLEAGRS